MSTRPRNRENRFSKHRGKQFEMLLTYLETFCRWVTLTNAAVFSTVSRSFIMDSCIYTKLLVACEQSSPIWASEASLARTCERGAEENL